MPAGAGQALRRAGGGQALPRNPSHACRHEQPRRALAPAEPALREGRPAAAGLVAPGRSFSQGFLRPARSRRSHEYHGRPGLAAYAGGRPFLSDLRTVMPLMTTRTTLRAALAL